MILKASSEEGGIRYLLCVQVKESRRRSQLCFACDFNIRNIAFFIAKADQTLGSLVWQIKKLKILFKITFYKKLELLKYVFWVVCYFEQSKLWKLVNSKNLESPEGRPKFSQPNMRLLCRNLNMCASYAKIVESFNPSLLILSSSRRVKRV